MIARLFCWLGFHDMHPIPHNHVKHFVCLRCSHGVLYDTPQTVKDVTSVVCSRGPMTHKELRAAEYSAMLARMRVRTEQ